MARYQEELATLTTARERIEASKVWMVEVLACLGKPELLNPWLSRLSRPCVAKLHEIAMRAELKSYSHPVNEDRPVANMGEALVAGSAAAWLLCQRAEFRKQKAKLLRVLNAKQVVLRRKKKEAERAQLIAKAEQVRAVADEQLAKLGAKTQ